MHDTLSYFAEDPIHRRYHHQRLTFGQLYAYSENFVLPFSHDEVVHGMPSEKRILKSGDIVSIDPSEGIWRTDAILDATVLDFQIASDGQSVIAPTVPT